VASLFSNGNAREGLVAVFRGSASGVPAIGDPTTADHAFESDQADARFGGDVAAAGDVDGDGFDDLIVGASRFHSGEFVKGGAFVFYIPEPQSLPALIAGAGALLGLRARWQSEGLRSAIDRGASGRVLFSDETMGKRNYVFGSAR
jgi:hypothetical protein